MTASKWKVGRDSSGWTVVDPKGRLFYDAGWRWNSRATARAVAWEMQGSHPSGWTPDMRLAPNASL